MDLHVILKMTRSQVYNIGSSSPQAIYLSFNFPSPLITHGWCLQIPINSTHLLLLLACLRAPLVPLETNVFLDIFCLLVM